MKYAEQFHKLTETSGSKFGLKRIREADALLGTPSQRFRSIHIAGTNGKGTVSTKIAQTLTSMGFKTGLFTSPHISSFRERIQIDGDMIPEEEALKELELLTKNSPKLTFFELLTLLAFLYFAKNGVDYAVFETGLGGEKDATNILKPQLTVITNISYDHADILGDSLDEIAYAKAGIIKSKTPLVLGSRATRKPILKAAFEKKVPTYFVRKHEDWFEENTAIAKRALNVILSSPDIDVSKHRPPCRFEEYEDMIFDGAHNEDGLKKLFSEVKKKYPRRKIFTVFSLSSGRDKELIIPIIKEGSDYLFYFEGEHPRICSHEEVKICLPGTSHTNLDRFAAFAKKENGILLITGSFFIMSELKEAFGITSEKDLQLLCD